MYNSAHNTFRTHVYIHVSVGDGNKANYLLHPVRHSEEDVRETNGSMEHTVCPDWKMAVEFKESATVLDTAVRQMDKQLRRAIVLLNVY